MPRWEAVAVCENSVSKLLDTGNDEPYVRRAKYDMGQQITARRRSNSCEENVLGWQSTLMLG